MKCPKCGCPDTRVVDSRPTDNEGIRRRRECYKCKNRFTTYETYEISNYTPLVVLKKNGAVQLFDRNKIMAGIVQACYKRPVSKAQMKEIVDSIENELTASKKNEVKSTEIGFMVMEKLRAVDDVSYVRFASVYREFRDVGAFRKEIDDMEKGK